MLRKKKYSDSEEILELSKTIFNVREIFTIDFIKKNSGYVYIHENKIIAYILFLDKLITSLGVKNEYRKKGIGNLLLCLCKKTNNELFLHVRSQNFQAINLYKKNGFIEIQRIKNYYTNMDDDALYMKYSI